MISNERLTRIHNQRNAMYVKAARMEEKEPSKRWRSVMRLSDEIMCMAQELLAARACVEVLRRTEGCSNEQRREGDKCLKHKALEAYDDATREMGK